MRQGCAPAGEDALGVEMRTGMVGDAAACGRCQPYPGQRGAQTGAGAVLARFAAALFAGRAAQLVRRRCVSASQRSYLARPAWLMARWEGKLEREA